MARNVGEQAMVCKCGAEILTLNDAEMYRRFGVCDRCFVEAYELYLDGVTPDPGISRVVRDYDFNSGDMLT